MGPQKDPMPLGHEMSGIVIEIGTDVKDININDRVAINPMGNNNSIGNGGPEGGMTNFLLVKNAILNESIFINKRYCLTKSIWLPETTSTADFSPKSDTKYSLLNPSNFAIIRSILL